MTTIKLYNTKTRQKEVFTPLNDQDVRMYVCGPTVYDRAHLGNARPVIVFDVLNRLLRHVYGKDHVTYVRNFTDVDDRINETAQKRKAAGADGSLEELIAARADETIDWYHEDMDAVGAMRPDHEPRATGYIGQMIAMIEDLVAKGHAYAAEGHALFAVDSYADYGALSGRSTDDMIAGARVEVAPYKRNPMDFVLWKPSPDDLPGWDSPWGRGRPGWHIECSAMAHELLGESFDIHGGGNDLQFPHHENEIAQSTCVGHGFANVWMHNEMLQVEGKKMSKSLGNFFTVRDLLEQGVPGEVIRFVMLSTHYRKPMDWTEKKRAEAEKTLRKWRRQVTLPSLGSASDNGKPELLPTVLSALVDDLNTPKAISILRKLSEAGDKKNLKEGAQMLGLLTEELGTWDEYLSFGGVRQIINYKTEIDLKDMSDAEIAESADLSLQFVTKNRTKLEQQISDVIKLAKENTAAISEFSGNFINELMTGHDDEPAENAKKAKSAGIVALLEQRAQAKEERNWGEADRIRDDICRLGFEIIDTDEGAKWRLLQ